MHTLDPKSQIFIYFALQSTVFEIFMILGLPVDSHVETH